MRICAEFESEDAAIEGHRALLDEGVPPESIDVRSAYPLPETIHLPQREHPMKLRQWIRVMWVTGALVGFSFLAYTQLIWPIRTGGHPLVPLPVDFILTYECGMITAIIMTFVFLYIETMRYRNLNPPAEEDLPVERGNIAVIVNGHGAEKAQAILQSKGAKSIIKFIFLAAISLPFLTGCAVKMRDQAYIKSTEAPQVPQPSGTLSMPTLKEQAAPIVKPLGYFHPPQMRMLDKRKLTVPKEFAAFGNPIPADGESIARGKILYEHNCIFCHGDHGKGDGGVGKIFQPTPADLTSAKVKGDSDGALFYFITIGPATMPSFANRLSTRERFDLINYIRTLQK